VQTQSTHWQTGTQLKYGQKYFSMQTMQRFSAKDAMFPFFVKKLLFVNQGEMFLAFVCIQEVVCVCVLLESFIFCETPRRCN